ncbi:hypothetical protein BGX38DRAFT_1268783 [Terfezia claveryi]|nr:hypothetical protein BGX38DRAFT_1268783 [Terfezia claveryi]
MSSMQVSAGTRDTPPIEPPSRRGAGRKRKDKGLPDTPSQGVDNGPSQRSSHRPLAKRPAPDTQHPNPIGQFCSSYSKEKPSSDLNQTTAGPPSVILSWYSHLERITFLAAEILRITRMIKLAMPIFQPLYWPDVETLLYKSESLQQSYMELKKSVQQSMPSLVACPWRSHLESINSLAVVITQIAYDVSSSTSQLLLQIDVQTLLQESEDLQKSYFELKRCVQQPMLSLGGANSYYSKDLLDEMYME